MQSDQHKDQLSYNYVSVKSVILFGSSESGKSTFLQHLKISESRKTAQFGHIIQQSCVHDLYNLLSPIIERQTIVETVSNRLNLTNILN